MANALAPVAAAAVVAPAAAAPAAAPAAQPKKTWSESFNTYVDWTAKNTFEGVRSTFSIKTTGTDADPADGAMKKAAKMFAMLLSSIVLLPFSLVGCAFHWIKDNLCGTVKADGANGATAPPAAVVVPPAAVVVPPAAVVVPPAAVVVPPAAVVVPPAAVVVPPAQPPVILNVPVVPPAAP